MDLINYHEGNSADGNTMDAEINVTSGVHGWRQRALSNRLDFPSCFRRLLKISVVAMVLFLSVFAHFYLFTSIAAKPESAPQKKESAPMPHPVLAQLEKPAEEAKEIPLPIPAAKLEPVAAAPVDRKATREIETEKKAVAKEKKITNLEHSKNVIIEQDDAAPRIMPGQFLAEIQALGQASMKSISQTGEGLPALDISYPDPVGYIRELYRLGAKTVLEGDFTEAPLMLVDLTQSTSSGSPFRREDLGSFSKARRRINDEVLLKRVSITQRIGNHNLLLLVPVSLEALWLGSLAESARLHNIPVTEISRAKCDYVSNAGGILHCRQAVLKDGTTVALGRRTYDSSR